MHRLVSTHVYTLRDTNRMIDFQGAGNKQAQNAAPGHGSAGLLSGGVEVQGKDQLEEVAGNSSSSLVNEDLWCLPL